MKKFILSLALTAFLSGAFQMLLPWWIIAIVAFAVAFFIKQNSLAAFVAAFIAVFLLWVGYAYYLSMANNNILVPKIAELLKVITKGNVNILYLFTGVIGGLVSGFGALTGTFARAKES